MKLQNNDNYGGEGLINVVEQIRNSIVINIVS
jgi:hypothetical protein